MKRADTQRWIAIVMAFLESPGSSSGLIFVIVPTEVNVLSFSKITMLDISIHVVSIIFPVSFNI